MTSISKWNIFIPGFMQKNGQPVGITKLWRKAIENTNSPSTANLLYHWDSDFENVAELVKRFTNGTNPDVDIVCYSWGGQSAMNLSRFLGRRRIDVRSIIAADPVYRHSYALGWWRTFMPSRFAIKVPPNVRHVHWVRQRHDWPRAHNLEAESPYTLISKPQVLQLSHQDIDDSQEFERLVAFHLWRGAKREVLQEA